MGPPWSALTRRVEITPAGAQGEVRHAGPNSHVAFLLIVRLVRGIVAQAVELAQFGGDLCKDPSQMVETGRVVKAPSALVSQQLQVIRAALVSNAQRFAF